MDSADDRHSESEDDTSDFCNFLKENPWIFIKIAFQLFLSRLMLEKEYSSLFGQYYAS